MSKVTLVFLTLIIAFLFLMGILGTMLIVFRNDAVTFQKTITAQISDMQAKYNEYFLKVKEAAQVPEEQMTRLKEFYDVLIQGRKQNTEMFRWIAEQNPEIKQETFIELQRIIASGRAEIYSIQKIHIDTVREYNTFLIIFPNNIVNNVFHFKTTNPTVPITENIREIFDSQKDKIIDVF